MPPTPRSDPLGTLYVSGRYAERGFHIMLCHAVGNDGRCTCLNPRCENVAKHPRFITGLQEHGLKDATNDIAELRRRFAKYPHSSIAFSAGPSGIVCIDVDPAGMDVWRAFVSEHDLPATLSQFTGRGLHVLYRAPAGQRFTNSSGSLPTGIDIRADGGYFLVAPSVHVSGQRYRWVDEQVPLMPLPDVLRQMLTPVVSVPPSARTAEGQLYGLGERNQGLASLAGTMRRRGMTAREIAAALHVVNSERCRPPLAPSEVDRISQSVGRYAPSSDRPNRVRWIGAPRG
jgi:putative DNA primase/helicase